MSATIIFLIATTLTDVLDARGHYRVIGGSETEIERYPSQVSIRIDGSHHCGGSIISHTFILTAAHCVVGIPKNLYTVRVGSTHLDKGGKIFNVTEIYSHPDYTIKFENDIALIELASSIKFCKRVKPITLANGPLPPAGTMGEICGWGRTEAKVDEMSNLLQRLNVPILEHEKCEELFKPPKYVIDDKMFCAGFLKGQRDSCLGDSGGPYIIDGIQYGLVSWGVGCALENKPGVYAVVYKFRDYIRKISGV